MTSFNIELQKWTGQDCLESGLMYIQLNTYGEILNM